MYKVSYIVQKYQIYRCCSQCKQKFYFINANKKIHEE